MSKRIINAANYTPTSNDRLFFDCNVMMYIFYTAGSYSNNDIRIYTNIFNNAIRNKASIFIPSIFISEFVNSYIQAEYKRYIRINQLDKETFKFKYDYRQTDDYKDTIQDVSNIINNQLLIIGHKLDDIFSEIDISNIFNNEQTFDFNDRYYIELAKKNNLKIITNDSDFYIDENVDIITYNRKLLYKK
ncbi:PIN domain-containing protein [Herbinix hemicellulosilytica]|uniref:PIN domain-containing protein n=1 Tax=Herbinix hemicellulosilytica TaxID=1564487 RepID=A0A0H5SII6_HERHM|nr:PIN domain-containing protein [Herbinix hemicellulosilytica]RBP60906.1 PIN domain-containing protein [Herbinix hemicellulosilytica]CRZ34601.1 hypothetical protein HHT355_1400 [Herbinix hemicellulosilytica]